MFSGIVQQIGELKEVKKKQGGTSFLLETHLQKKWREGESVLVSGICTTIKEIENKLLSCFYMPETLRVTTADAWNVGRLVNIEPSLKIGDELGGHLVFGHIDGIARVQSLKMVGDALVVNWVAPKNLTIYLAPKGSVAIDGVSLTVVKIKNEQFSTSLIPYTQEHTTLGRLSKGDKVNIEADMLAKYVARVALQYRTSL